MAGELLVENVKVLCGIEADEHAYDREVSLLIDSAIGRMKMAGINAAILGETTEGKVVTVGNYRVGKFKVGEIIATGDTNERVIEYIATHAKIGLYQDATKSFYQIMKEREDELLTTMAFSSMSDN